MCAIVTTELAMVLVATALTRFTLVHSRTASDDEYFAQLAKKNYAEEVMAPDIAEQLVKRDIEADIRKREPLDKYVPIGKYMPPKSNRNIGKKRLVENPANGAAASEEHKRRSAGHSEEIDVVDREDHVTQYLAELLVNTDSEITSLQASEHEEDRDVVEVKGDTFFAFLTGQEKSLEVEGAWSKPTANDDDDDDEEERTNAKKGDYIPNILIDE